jgi:hypothetical protein
MKMYVSRGGKDCGGALILDYPPENPPGAIRYNGKDYRACADWYDGAVLYTPDDFVDPDLSIEVVENDGCVGRSAFARIEKIEECDD